MEESSRGLPEDARWFDVTPEMLERATKLAQARLTESHRRLSPDRKSARNLQSQIRGALGEIVGALWLSENQLLTERGFEDDMPFASDLAVRGIPIEVMTAKIGDRDKTGFCVPPNKLRAAQARGAWGYLFIGTDDHSPPRRLLVQAVTRVDLVDTRPPRETFVNNPAFAVLNYVIEPQNLQSPTVLVEHLRQL